MALTDTALRAVKSGEKAIKLFDGDGLFLFVTPSGTKSWRLKYHFQNKEKLIVLGQYPLLSLKEARQRAMDARKSIANGKDPSAERKQAKVLLQNTFEMVAMEWHQKQSPAWSSNYAETNMYRMRRNLFPHVGSRPIADITAPELLTGVSHFIAKKRLFCK